MNLVDRLNIKSKPEISAYIAIGDFAGVYAKVYAGDHLILGDDGYFYNKAGKYICNVGSSNCKNYIRKE